MSLSHYKNSKAAVNRWEVVTPGLWECTIITPDAENTPLLIEHIRSIDGLDGINPSNQIVQQKYKYAERSYAGLPEQNHLELTVVFTMNLNDSNENYIYTTLRRWFDRRFDPNTGAMGLKKDYYGTMVLVQYNRDGSIWRKINCLDVIPGAQLAILGSLSYDSGDPAEISLPLVVDWWEEETIGL